LRESAAFAEFPGRKIQNIPFPWHLEQLRMVEPDDCTEGMIRAIGHLAGSGNIQALVRVKAFNTALASPGRRLYAY